MGPYLGVIGSVAISCMVAPMTFLSGKCGVDGLTRLNRPNKPSLAGLLAAVDSASFKKRWHNCRNGATAKIQHPDKHVMQTDTWENERVDGIGLVRPILCAWSPMWKRLVAHGSRVAGRISHYLFQEGFSLRPHRPSSVIV